MFVYTQNVLLILWYSIPLSSFCCIFPQSDPQGPTLLAILLSKAFPFSTWCLITIAVGTWPLSGWRSFGMETDVCQLDLYQCFPPSERAEVAIPHHLPSPRKQRRTSVPWAWLFQMVHVTVILWHPSSVSGVFTLSWGKRISFPELRSRTCVDHTPPLSGHPLTG